MKWSMPLSELDDAFRTLDGAGSTTDAVTATDEPKIVLPSLPYLGEIDKRGSKQKGQFK